MRVLLAGASGAIGQPLIRELICHGHTILAICRSEAGRQKIIKQGATADIVDVLDESSVLDCLKRFSADIVIDELTSLPKDPWEFASAVDRDRRIRVEGGGNLLRAAQATGVRRYVQQASGFFLKSDSGLADESSPLAIDASPGVAGSSQTYAELESRLLHQEKLEPVILRYGFFYGPGTWYSPDGACGEHVRRQETPIIGEGQAVWSWIHIDDAALATAAAISAPSGIYNIVDDDPSPVSRWLPAFAKSLGAPSPPHVTEAQALQTSDEDAVYYGTRLSGASSQKAKGAFNFKPRSLEWLL